MKNLLNEKPDDKLYGRLLASVKFVDDVDIINKDVLDIGCGFGWCELNFLKRGVKKISAIEISEDSLKTIRDNIHDERLTLVAGSAIKLPFENESFDAVVSWEVIEHIPRGTENQMFEEVYRVLRPGGYFYLSTPHSSFFSNILDPAWWLVGHRHYSGDNLLSYAKNNNFSQVKNEIKGGWWTLASIINMYFAKWILRRSAIFLNFFKEKEHAEYLSGGFVNIFTKFYK